jgi:hypothetical protein
LPEATDLLMRAEGSDWFWWYSEYHQDEYEAVFDELFRDNLGAVYVALGLPEPPDLAEPISAVTFGWLARSPAGYMQPSITGRVNDYFEWQPAGLLRTAALASAMHRSDHLIREVYFGYDHDALYLRVDTMGPAGQALADGALRFTFPGRPDRELTISPVAGKPGAAHLGGDLAGAVEAAIDAIVEVRLDRAAVGAAGDGFLTFAVSVDLDGQLAERWPQRGFVRLETPAADALSSSWIV